MKKSIKIYLCCTGLVCFIVSVQNFETEKANETNWIGAYYSLSAVRKALEFSETNVGDKWAGEKMLSTFDNFVSTLPPANVTIRKFPFFVVEGNHRIRKYVVARKLARYIYAANLINPPEFLASFKNVFNTIGARRAFYTLGHYANAQYARVLLERRPVVMAGYWLDIAAFSLAKKYPEQFPPWGSEEMKWPEDLLAPDVIFYINTPTKINEVYGTTRIPSVLKPRLIQLYQHWQYPRIVEINRFYADNEMFDEIFRHVNYIKHSTYPEAVKYYDKH